MPTPQPRAGYDEDGNVIIFGSEGAPVQNNAEQPTVQVPKMTVSPIVRPERRTAASPRIDAVLSEWNTIEEPLVHEQKSQQPVARHSRIITQETGENPAPQKQKKVPHTHFVKRIAKATNHLLISSLEEGKAQFGTTGSNARKSVDEAVDHLKHLPRHTASAAQRVWKAAGTERQFPWQRARAKPRSKTTLFVIDTIRFGGTFAAIFIALFVAINYQSFWQIARAQLALGNDAATEQELGQIVRRDVPAALPTGMSAGNAVRDSAELTSLLPRVGPYENRLIIPKIGKNVPIIMPSMNALMREDWKQFEDDVQYALHEGVVHYPGSARPGQTGNFFVTGHSSYYPWDDGKYKDVFARLPELDLGDTYSVYYGGDLHSYRIISKKEVRPSDTTVLDQPTDKRIATLMTCTPVGTTLKRLIIVAEEIDPATGAKMVVGQRATAESGKRVKLEALPI